MIACHACVQPTTSPSVVTNAGHSRGSMYVTTPILSAPRAAPHAARCRHAVSRCSGVPTCAPPSMARAAHVAKRTNQFNSDHKTCSANKRSSYKMRIVTVFMRTCGLTMHADNASSNKNASDPPGSSAVWDSWPSDRLA